MDYQSVLKKHPDVEKLLKEIVKEYGKPPVRSIYLTGGITLGDFSPHLSDIDLVIVIDKDFEDAQNVMASHKKAVLKQKFGEKTSIFYVESDQLHKETLQAHKTDGREHELHEFDMLLLREYSVVLHGPDDRAQMHPHEESTVIGPIIEHIIERILPRTLETGGVDDMMGVTFVMARSTYVLYTGEATSKSDAALWLKANVPEYPFLQHLSFLANRFARWYKTGVPKSVDRRLLRTEFTHACASFLTAVLHHRNVPSRPELFFEGDMLSTFHRLELSKRH